MTPGIRISLLPPLTASCLGQLVFLVVPVDADNLLASTLGGLDQDYRQLFLGSATEPGEVWHISLAADRAGGTGTSAAHVCDGGKHTASGCPAHGICFHLCHHTIPESSPLCSWTLERRWSPARRRRLSRLYMWVPHTPHSPHSPRRPSSCRPAGPQAQLTEQSVRVGSVADEDSAATGRHGQLP